MSLCTRMSLCSSISRHADTQQILAEDRNDSASQRFCIETILDSGTEDRKRRGFRWFIGVSPLCWRKQHSWMSQKRFEDTAKRVNYIWQYIWQLVHSCNARRMCQMCAQTITFHQHQLDLRSFSSISKYTMGNGP